MVSCLQACGILVGRTLSPCERRTLEGRQRGVFCTTTDCWRNLRSPHKHDQTSRLGCTVGIDWIGSEVNFLNSNTPSSVCSGESILERGESPCFHLLADIGCIVVAEILKGIRRFGTCQEALNCELPRASSNRRMDSQLTVRLPSEWWTLQHQGQQ